MENEWPTVYIKGTEFIVDVNKFELREKGNEENKLLLSDFHERENGYGFYFDTSVKNHPYEHNYINDTTSYVMIPEFVKMATQEMSKKYGVPMNEISKMSDFDLIVGRKEFDMRVNKGMLPTIDIAGHTFFVDIRMDKLRPKDDFLSKGIVFSDIGNYYDEHKRTYTIPYNPKTLEFQEPDYRTIKEFPKDLIAVRFPFERLLDTIGWNRHYGFEMMHGLAKQDLKLQFEAKQIPWEKTFLVDLIKSNLKAERNLQKTVEIQQPTQADKSQPKGRKI